MSKETVQFVEIIRQALAQCGATQARWCLVCEAKTRQTVQPIPGWLQYRCLECGFCESVQEKTGY